MSPGTYVHQGIIQNTASLVFSVALEARKQAGEDASFSPDVLVWRDRSLNRHPVDESSNFFNDLARFRMIGIKQPASRGQLCFGNWGVPCAHGSQHQFVFFGKTVLEDVNVNGRIVQQLGRPHCSCFY